MKYNYLATWHFKHFFLVKPRHPAHRGFEARVARRLRHLPALRVRVNPEQNKPANESRRPVEAPARVYIHARNERHRAGIRGSSGWIYSSSARLLPPPKLQRRALTTRARPPRLYTYVHARPRGLSQDRRPLRERERLPCRRRVSGFPAGPRRARGKKAPALPFPPSRRLMDYEPATGR